MSRRRRRAERLTDLILETFRLNGALLAAGDSLVRDLGLSSARWQVLGAVALGGPLTVSQAARRMGLTRQAIQRVANELAADGLVAFEDNPEHRRAKLLTLTDGGRAAYAEANDRQESWADALAEGLDLAAVEAALGIVRSLRERLDASADAGATEGGENG